MYSREERIGFSRVGEDGLLTLGGLVDYFQDSSTFQSEDLGVGVGELLQENSCWILLSWQIVVNQLPKCNQRVVVKTWPSGFKGFLGNRNYIMETVEGEILAYANSIWTYADVHTGKPKRVPESVYEKYPLKPPFPMECISRKIKLPERMNRLGESFVTKSSIDTNHHMNNSRYVSLGCDYLPDNRRVKQLRVEYRQASRLGEKLMVLGEIMNDGYYLALKGENGEIKTAMEFLFT